jgi:hypothetical protein
MGEGIFFAETVKRFNSDKDKEFVHTDIVEHMVGDLGSRYLGERERVLNAVKRVKSSKNEKGIALYEDVAEAMHDDATLLYFENNMQALDSLRKLGVVPSERDDGFNINGKNADEIVEFFKGRGYAQMVDRTASVAALSEAGSSVPANMVRGLENSIGPNEENEQFERDLREDGRENTFSYLVFKAPTKYNGVDVNIIVKVIESEFTKVADMDPMTYSEIMSIGLTYNAPAIRTIVREADAAEVEMMNKRRMVRES